MKYFDFFKERIPELPSPNDRNECVVKCIFHPDGNPSLTINVESGKWRCMTPSCPGHAGGGWKKFEQLLKGEGPGVSPIAAPPIDAAVIEGFHRILLQSELNMKFLADTRGLTRELVERFQLGYDGDRFLIPIKGQDGSWVNVRKYKPGAKKDKMVAWGPRYNRPRLFPIQELAAYEWVLLTEGETDCLAAIQQRLPGLTVTGGADTWAKEFNHELRGKRVVICYDADEAGRLGAVRVANHIVDYATEVRILTLPLGGNKEEKDLTDYFVKLRHTREEFDRLLETAEPFEKQVAERNTTAPPNEVEAIHLSQIGLDRLVAKRVKAVTLIAGKDLAPFQVPQKINFACKAVGSQEMCDRCGICKGNGNSAVEVPNWSPDLLRMVNVPVEKLDAHLRRLADVPWPCDRFSFEVKEYANIESIKAIPEIDFDAQQSEYVIRSLYYLGHGLETNRTYTIEGVVMPDPKTQYATALIYNAEPSVDAIEKFHQTDELRAALSIFQVKEQ